MKLTYAACVALIPLAGVPYAGAQGAPSFDYRVSLTSEYSEASQSVRILDKYASFRTGGGGLKIEASHSKLGALYIGGGGGYSPRETASFVGANVQGSATSAFFEYGYSYQHQLSRNAELVFSVDYIAYDIEGDFLGDRAGVPVLANITSDISTIDYSVAWRQPVSKKMSISFGVGTRHWEIEALAEGSLGQSIHASTRAMAIGRDPLAFIELEVSSFGYPLSARYQRSELSADNTVVLNTIQFQLDLPL